MIKNETIFKGRPKLKFEKYPEYSGRSVLNKVHLDLGFTKLVSRVNTSNYDKEKINLINLNTGGSISWYEIEGFEDIPMLAFLGPNREYVGSPKEGWWYFKNNMRVCAEFPIGVAEVWNKDNTNIEGYYGYSHRGGNLFKIGDRLFEEDYKGNEEDYEEWQWSGWRIQYKEELKAAYDEYEETGDDWWLKDIKEDDITRYIPFNLRGSKVITTMEEAKQAALNLSRYLG